MRAAGWILLVALAAAPTAHAEAPPAEEPWTPPPIARPARRLRLDSAEPPRTELLLTLAAGPRYRHFLGFDLLGGDFAFFTDALFPNGLTLGGGILASVTRTSHGLVGTQVDALFSIGGFATERLHIGGTFGFGGVGIGHNSDLIFSTEFGVAGDVVRFDAGALFVGVYGGATLLAFSEYQHNAHSSWVPEAALRIGVRFRLRGRRYHYER